MKLFKKLSIILAIALVLSLTLSVNIFATETDTVTEATTEEVTPTSSKLDMDLAGGDLSMSERLEYALQGTVTGMLMIFLVLGLLAAIVSLSKVVFYDIPNKKKGEKEAASTPVTVAEPTVEEETDEAIYTEDDTQLAAVITAAIAAMLDSEQYSNEFKSGFRVVSFKRVNTNSAWNKK